MPRNLIMPCHLTACTTTQVDCKDSTTTTPYPALSTSRKLCQTFVINSDIQGRKPAPVHTNVLRRHNLSNTALRMDQIVGFYVFTTKMRTLNYNRRRSRKRKNNCLMVTSKMYDAKAIRLLLRIELLQTVQLMSEEQTTSNAEVYDKNFIPI